MVSIFALKMAGTVVTDSDYHPLKETVHVCSICFESYKTPRCLPCLHTFCHACLSSYIGSTCQQKQRPVGFGCPLCRSFVPAPVYDKSPEKWAENFPIDKQLEALCAKGNEMNYCDPCKRMNDEVTATDWCTECMESLCCACAKAHGRSRASQNHKMLNLTSEMSAQGEGHNHVDVCRTHTKKIKYFCQDHLVPCCTQCICTEHRGCKQVDSILHEAQTLFKAKKIDSLLMEIEKYEKAVTKLKSERQDNVAELDNSSDTMLQSADELRKKIISHLDAMLEKHKNEISKNLKVCREKQSVAIECFSDRQLLAESYAGTLKKVKEGGASVALVVEYHRIKQELSEILNEKVYSSTLKLSQNIDENLQEILKVAEFGKLNLDECSTGFDYSLALSTMNLICELDLSDGNVTGGCFLSNEEILLINFETDCLEHFTADGKLSHTLLTNFFPDDACLKNSMMNTLYVTSSDISNELYGVYMVRLPESKEKTMEILKLPLEKSCFGVTYMSEFLYVACDDVIIKMNCYGDFVCDFQTEKETYSVAVNKKNHIVSSSCSSHSVLAIDEYGQRLFQYKHPDLKYPYGLDVDSEGYIFVAGRDSNNIHILSPMGELIKILPALKPKCIKFRKDSRVCLIGSEKACKTKLCEFK